MTFDGDDGSTIDDACQRILTGARSWVTSNLAWFGPEKRDEHFPPREVPVQNALELLLFCTMLDRLDAPAPELSGAAESIVETLLAPADLVAEAANPIGNFTYLMWAAHLADTASLRDARLRIREIVEQMGELLQRLDQPRTVQFEVKYAASLGGIGDSLAGFSELYGERPYGTRDADGLDDAQAYAVTHDILYATDFGGHALEASEETTRGIGQFARDLLTAFLRREQWDLVAELTHCAIATPGHDRAPRVSHPSSTDL